MDLGAYIEMDIVPLHSNTPDDMKSRVVSRDAANFNRANLGTTNFPLLSYADRCFFK